MVENKHAYFVVGFLLVVLLSGTATTQVDGQAGSLDIVMSNMYVTASMST